MNIHQMLPVTGLAILLSGQAVSQEVKVSPIPELIFSEDFNDYLPLNSSRQPDTGLDMHYSGTVPGWTGTGTHHSHAVDLDCGPGTDFALQLFSGTSSNTLTLDNGIAANAADAFYEVSFDSGPTSWDPWEATDSTDGLLIEILRADNTILASCIHRPGAWTGTPSSQDLISPGVFTYAGDGSGDVRIRLATEPTGSNRFGGAIDNLGVGRVSAQPVEWPVASGGNGHWYEAVHVESGITWTDARDAALIEGGHLSTITSEEENDFVFSVANANPDVWHTDASNHVVGPWLGGYQPEGSAEPAGGWRWVTAEPFDYTLWDLGVQPNDVDGGQDFLGFYGKGLGIPTKYWNDFGTPVTGYVVEYIPEPSTLLLALLALGVVGGWRKWNRAA